MRDESIVLVPLTQGKEAVIDAADAERVLAHKWHAFWTGRRWYAARSIGTSRQRQYVYMHRFILDTPTGLWTDHKDGDGLNNRRSNLRDATPQQNCANSAGRLPGASGYRGVFRKRAKWGARIGHNGRTIHLGTFADPEDAARAYDEAARQLHGEFAVTNF